MVRGGMSGPSSPNLIMIGDRAPRAEKYLISLQIEGHYTRNRMFVYIINV